MPILDFVARKIVRLKLTLASALLVSFVGPMAMAKEPSLYDLTSLWKDQKGEAFSWKDIHGKVVLLSMVYTSCEQTCPLILSELAALQKGLPARLQGQVQVLIFSFDPDRDSQERLAQYAKERKLDPAWRLLRGTNEDVQELAAVLGFRYKKLTSGDYAHSNIFTVLNQKGEIRHQQTVLFSGRSETLSAVQKLFDINPP